jgi:hypothetical protein
MEAISHFSRLHSYNAYRAGSDGNIIKLLTIDFCMQTNCLEVFWRRDADQKCVKNSKSIMKPEVKIVSRTTSR